MGVLSNAELVALVKSRAKDGLATFYDVIVVKGIAKMTVQYQSYSQYRVVATRTITVSRNVTLTASATDSVFDNSVPSGMASGSIARVSDVGEVAYNVVQKAVSRIESIVGNFTASTVTMSNYTYCHTSCHGSRGRR